MELDNQEPQEHPVSRASAALQQAAGVAKKPKTLAEIIASDTTKKQIALALPKHMNTERMTRIIMTEMRKVPKLAECDPVSFLGAVMTVSQFGLEVGAALGHAYLLPFDNRKNGTTECQLIIGDKGLLDLARRSGQIVSISPRAVYANDEFSYEYGLNETIKHVPTDGESGELVYVYAVAKLKDGGTQFEVMSRKQVEKIRATSKSGSSPYSPWATHFDEMAKKTVLRRLCKYLPSSLELARAVTIDEIGDVVGASQKDVFEGEYNEVTESWQA